MWRDLFCDNAFDMVTFYSILKIKIKENSTVMGLNLFPPSFYPSGLLGEGVIDLCCDWKHNPLLPPMSPPRVWIIPS